MLSICKFKFDGCVYFFCFGLKMSFLGKFDPNEQNCLFKMKVGITTNSNMLNLMVMFTFTVLGQEDLFLTNLFQGSKLSI